MKDMKDLTIGIIGGGTVGRALARCYQEHVQHVRVWDKDPTRSTVKLPFDALDNDLIFVCVPETQLESIFASSQIDNFHKSTFVIKSTTPIGTTRRLMEEYGLPNLVHSPEFLTERCAMTDVQMPAHNLVGVPYEAEASKWNLDIARRWDDRGYSTLIRLYQSRFRGVPVSLMSSDESEAVKLFLNGFFSVKVAFFNELYQLAKALDLNWNVIHSAMLEDGRICQSHTQVPGPDGQLGFGGKCLPKDLLTLLEHLRPLFPRESLITEAANTRNFTDRFNPL